MINQSFYKGISKLLLGLLLSLGLLALVQISYLQAQENRPMVPRLSLTGADNDYDATWYPDGRIWIPPSVDPNHPREILVPVFIENKWYTHPETQDIYIADPIKSFQFKVFYDSTALRAIGVQTFGSRRLNYFTDEKFAYHTLAKDFQISWMDDRDTNFRKYLNPYTPLQDKNKGRAIRISGVSTNPLPVSEGFSVLLYIRFMLVPKAGQPIGIASNTPLYIGPDSIIYNDLNVRTEAPFKKFRPTWKGRDVQQDYPDPDAKTGLAGIDNSAYPNWNVEPYLPGVIYLRISDNTPRFGFILERAIGLIPAIQEVYPFDGSLFEMRDPITVDSATISNFPWGRREFQLVNIVSTSRLIDIDIESDQPWLWFRTVTKGPQTKNPIPAPTQKGYINYIDNGILGNTALGTPIWGRNTNPDGEVHIEVMCDPTRMDNNNTPEHTGIYVGYLTFKSHSAEISPVRLKITFIYFRNPIEWTERTRPAGINLSVVPEGGFGQEVRLIFGTGYRATIGVDSLFGEYAEEQPMNPSYFGARFFPPENAPEEIKFAVSNGFGNFSPDDDNNDGTPKYCVSRDIRSSEDTLQSLIFLVRFSSENPDYYPIVLYWDTRDFPDGASLFLRDTANGQLFPAVNMRQATNQGGTRFSYTITDPRVRSFIIEYTPARIINYVDDYGNPVIKKGWNFLSLPVRPINRLWNNVYKNAINKPFFWSQNQYQFDDQLRVGVGYFVKYSDSIDTKFAGSYINEISVNVSLDTVKIYPGWNTIGCVSTTMAVRDIGFSPFGGETPQKDYVLQHGVWEYKTNRGYQEVSEIRPGLGYWIKSDKHGFLRLVGRFEKAIESEGPSVKELIRQNSVRINLLDNAQNEKTLYLVDNVDPSFFELPPIPMADMFDIRFANNSLTSGAENSVIRMQGVTYPISLSIENPRAEYIFTDAVTGELLGKINKQNQSLIINSSSNAVRILVSKDNTSEGITVYPNPVSNYSMLTYSVSQDSFVRISLYDMLGNLVSNLVEQDVKAGTYNLTIDASALANGQYLCKMFVDGQTLIQIVNVLR
ncbi:MAG: T9SS type A sorting domain-containing protein [Candidatus Kapaibacteriales bacterium]